MNQMEIFKNPEFGSIRVIEENGKYLFCGTDVAAALGYSNSRDAIIRHCRYVVKRDAPERGEGMAAGDRPADRQEAGGHHRHESHAGGTESR